MALTVRIDDKRAKKLINDILGRAKNKEVALKLIATQMHRNVLKHFDEEKGSGGKWKALAPSTKKWKAKHGYSKPLQNTGQLRRRNFPLTETNKAIVENRVGYASTHQFGTNKVPKRDFLWLSTLEIKSIVNYMKNYLVRGG